jgi:hypothetical protein
VLFQNDLWERVDGISAAIRNESGADWAVLKGVRTRGLERRGRDALLPVGAICIPDFTSRLPAASTSLMGHGPAGARVAERKR